MTRTLLWILRQAGPPLVLFLFVATIWHFATVQFDIERFLLPSPLDVGEAAVEHAKTLWQATLRTAGAAVCGFLASLVVGTVIAFVFAQSRVIRASCYPYAIFLQTVPIVAIAPLIVIWCGYGFHSVVLIAFIISLFPIITNATAGLTAVDTDLLDLFRLHNASRWQTLWKLRLPSAVPYVIAGARISSGMAVIGAIVGEFFTGYGSTTDVGLGYLIMQKSAQLKTDELFAAVIASTCLGMTVFVLVNLTGGTILKRWYDA